MPRLRMRDVRITWEASNCLTCGSPAKVSCVSKSGGRSEPHTFRKHVVLFAQACDCRHCLAAFRYAGQWNFDDNA